MSIVRQARLVTACVVLAVSSVAGAQTYPAKTVRVIVPYPPGGTTDVLGRIVGERLTEHRKHPVIVENRPGASGNIGADLVAKIRSRWLHPSGDAARHRDQSSPVQKLPYDARKDLAPITALAFSGLVVAVHPSTGIKTLQELIARAKAEPGKLNYGSCGNGTPHHLVGELLKSRAGIDLVHVPYKGCGFAQAAALAGRGAREHQLGRQRGPSDQGWPSAGPGGDFARARPGMAGHSDHRGVREAST